MYTNTFKTFLVHEIGLLPVNMNMYGSTCVADHWCPNGYDLQQYIIPHHGVCSLVSAAE